MTDLLHEALRRIAGVQADDGDTFEGYDDSVILRVEITTGDLRAIRAALEVEYVRADFLEAAAILCGEGYAFFSSFGGKAQLCLLCNDMFGPVADAEPIELSDAPDVLSIVEDHGYDGLEQWVANKRNATP